MHPQRPPLWASFFKTECAVVVHSRPTLGRTNHPQSQPSVPKDQYTPRNGVHVLFAVLFTDKPGQGALRQEHLQSHIEWVAEHKDKVLVAGSLRHEQGEVPKGGLWVVEAESKVAVHELMKTDPFFIIGLRQSIEVFFWSKALPDYQALV